MRRGEKATRPGALGCQPYLIDRRPNQLPGDFDFREVFNIPHAVFSRRRLKAEAKAAHRRKLAQADEDRELVHLVVDMHRLSVHDHAYAVLYRRCARLFLYIAADLHKPEPLPEPKQDAPPQRTFRNCRAPPPPPPLFFTPSLPVPEMPILPGHPVASALAASANPSPVPFLAPDLIVDTLPLPDTTSPTTLPSSPPLNVPMPAYQASSTQLRVLNPCATPPPCLSHSYHPCHCTHRHYRPPHRCPCLNLMKSRPRLLQTTQAQSPSRCRRCPHLQFMKSRCR